MKLFLVRTDTGDLVGWGPEDAGYIAHLEAGECLECETHKVRNPAHHRKFFALLDNAFLNQEKYTSKPALFLDLKIRAGWYNEHITQDGKVVFIPRSISFARMGQDQFDEFYDQAVIALASMFQNAEQVVAEADQIIARHA